MDDTTRQFEPVKATERDIPAAIRPPGSLQDIWKWTDASGENLLFTTLVAPFDDPEKDEFGEQGQTAEIYAFRFLRSDTGYQRIWMIHEKQKACPFDITCAFVKDAVTITDLDADRVAEVTLLYRLACRSDVSPAVLKLVMHEGETKYGFTGLSWVQGGPDEKFMVTEKDACLENLPGYRGTDAEMYQTFGRYETEKDFRGAPDEFLSHARGQWMRHVKESFE